MKPQDLEIVLGSELWDPELVAQLAAKGYTVKSMETTPQQVVISREAWRIPKTITQVELREHIDMILKQTRLLKHEAAPSESTPERAAAKPKAPRKRKPAAKAASEPVRAAPSEPEPEGER